MGGVTGFLTHLYTHNLKWTVGSSLTSAFITTLALKFLKSPSPLPQLAPQLVLDIPPPAPPIKEVPHSVPVLTVKPDTNAPHDGEKVKEKTPPPSPPAQYTAFGDTIGDFDWANFPEIYDDPKPIKSTNPKTAVDRKAGDPLPPPLPRNTSLSFGDQKERHDVFNGLQTLMQAASPDDRKNPHAFYLNHVIAHTPTPPGAQRLNKAMDLTQLLYNFTPEMRSPF